MKFGVRSPAAACCFLQPRSFGVLTPRCFPSRWVKGVGGQGCVCCH